jgi:hypothetical protein
VTEDVGVPVVALVEEGLEAVEGELVEVDLGAVERALAEGALEVEEALRAVVEDCVGEDLAAGFAVTGSVPLRHPHGSD